MRAGKVVVIGTLWRHSSVLSTVFMSLLSPVFQIHHFSEAFFIKEHSWEELQNSPDQLYVFVLLVLHVL